MQLAEQHGSESWDVLKAYLDFVLPMPAAQATLCTHPLTAMAHNGDAGQTNGVRVPAEVSVESVRVRQQCRGYPLTHRILWVSGCRLLLSWRWVCAYSRCSRTGSACSVLTKAGGT